MSQKKVAKLVSFAPMVRIIVDENATEEEIALAAFEKALHVMRNDGALDHVDVIKDDTEMPFGSSNHDVYYQPSFTGKEFPNDLHDHEVFASKEVAEYNFPDFKIIEYSGDDIENKVFVDEQFDQPKKAKV